MALRKTIEVTGVSKVLTPYGPYVKGDETVSVQDAYLRVEEVTGSKSKVLFSVSINADDGLTMKMKYEFTPNMDGENFIAQAYAYLKTLPEFSDATDV
jgi:hypothetical protein